MVGCIKRRDGLRSSELPRRANVCLNDCWQNEILTPLLSLRGVGTKPKCPNYIPTI